MTTNFFGKEDFRAMLEKNVENHLKNKVKAMGGIALKINSTNMAGMPDRMVLFPEGKIFFVELKAPGKKQDYYSCQHTEFYRVWGLRFM